MDRFESSDIKQNDARNLAKSAHVKLQYMLQHSWTIFDLLRSRKWSSHLPVTLTPPNFHRPASRVASCFLMSALAEAEAASSSRGELKASCHEVNASINALRTTWAERLFVESWNRLNTHPNMLIYVKKQDIADVYMILICIHTRILIQCIYIIYIDRIDLQSILYVFRISVLRFCWWYWRQMDELWIKCAGWNILSQRKLSCMLNHAGRAEETASHSNLPKALACEWTKMNQTW